MMTRGSEGTAPIRVFLLDDHEVVRRGVHDLIELEEDLTVVGEAGGADGALEHIRRAHPHVAVLDVQLPDGSGIEVCRAVRAELPDVNCLMLSSFADDEAVSASLLAGAVGYVVKDIRGRDLVASIRAAAAGRSLNDPLLLVRAAQRLRDEHDRDPRVDTLTAQERRILVRLTEGLTNRQIGGQLGLAEKTVKNYVSNVLVKMGMQHRTEAAVYAARHERPGGGPDEAAGPSFPAVHRGLPCRRSSEPEDCAPSSTDVDRAAEVPS